ncbi:unnamed protein product [Periconia digitata]|uniref:Uncharacterized protein n=1 Tax=Periconia digitata TaxID=1303443 RepID=A0A9W4XZ32_9PLEO|nr:unnamed protein product [Periconia digitata]
MHSQKHNISYSDTVTYQLARPPALTHKPTPNPLTRVALPPTHYPPTLEDRSQAKLANRTAKTAYQQSTVHLRSTVGSDLQLNIPRKQKQKHKG